ncbi:MULTISPECIES: autotransporter domain-containing protein [unclassified Pseudomonas]|uniref:autotransporter outer membrane beta-barrel domain-containing protein n=1 Tax=unclassified Pseudomonas TaxID=196821 RepID=UPI0015A3E412|nr:MULTISPECIES: autotransporter outer membrane beta-barrel domain-containing protein [unclassified Pseudomonas]NWC96198.1 autotransporter outer membrane beta-barrel domain-containing protein [Pseudomonas sp. IPO3779]NWD16714.1 autotransporter outer membrane beta-barrel domain-containing protein [Pseudomonas sp. IPO3778]
MPFIKKQLALAITLTMGVANLQYAQARGDIEPDSEWITQAPSHKPPAPAKPSEDFYFADHATTRNGLRVAHVLDNAVDTLLASGELNEWQAYQLENYGRELGNLPPGRVGAVLEQLAGSQNANLAAATQNSMNALNASLLSAMRQPGEDRDAADNGRIWFQGLGNAGTLDGQYTGAGLQQRTQGLVLGSDWAVDHAWRVGVMGAKSTSALHANRFKGELDSWHLGGYAVRLDGPVALRLGATYSNHAGKNKRTVDFDVADYREQSTGKYNAQSQNAFAEAGYQMNAGNVSVEPFGGVGYQRYHRDRYKEKGGLTALNVGAQTQENLSSTFGLRLASAYTLDNRMALKPHLSTGWKHLYGDVGSTVRQSSAWVKRPGFNSDFTIEGTSLDRDSLALRTGLDLELSPQHTVGLAYALEAGSHSRSQGLTGQWTLAF